MLKIIFINTVSNSSLINQWKTFVRKGSVILIENCHAASGPPGPSMANFVAIDGFPGPTMAIKPHTNYLHYLFHLIFSQHKDSPDITTHYISLSPVQELVLTSSPTIQEQLEIGMSFHIILLNQTICNHSPHL